MKLDRQTLDVLGRAYWLMTYANKGAFSNGVTDSTGSIDEREYYASLIIDEMREILIEHGENV